MDLTSLLYNSSETKKSHKSPETLRKERLKVIKNNRKSLTQNYDKS